MEFRVLKGKKIKQIREKQKLSLQEVVDLTGQKFTRGALAEWEKENYRPKDEFIPILLSALNCEWEDVSEPFTSACAV